MKEIIIKSREAADQHSVAVQSAFQDPTISAVVFECSGDSTRYVFQREPDCPDRIHWCTAIARDTVIWDRANEQKRIAWAIRAATERDDWKVLDADYPEIAKVVRNGLPVFRAECEDVPNDALAILKDDEGRLEIWAKSSTVLSSEKELELLQLLTKRAGLTAQGWLPRSTSPEDGTRILVNTDPVRIAHYCEESGLWPGDIEFTDDGEPCNVGYWTHWAPLPSDTTEGE